MARPAFRSSAGLAIRRNNLGQPEYVAGPLRADLTMGVKLRTGAAIPTGLFAGLLSHGPDPDGFGHVEASADGYWRMPISLYPHGLNRLAIPHPVTFEATAALVATHVGLFDADAGGELLWFGGLLGSRYATSPSPRHHFPAFSVTLAKPPAWGS